MLQTRHYVDVLFLSTIIAQAIPAQGFSRSINIVGDNFTIDGKPFQIRSGSIHYFRAPYKQWYLPLYAAKAAGLNAISTYIEWSFHEPEEREYHFELEHDVKKFIMIAEKLGLYVIIRPGPYICAERDLGGLPYWLLAKYPNIKLRTTDKDFIFETKIWMQRLFVELEPLLYGNGGPIILVQVENEYGSYGNDTEYKIAIRDIMKEHVGDKALLYTTDGSSYEDLNNGRVDGALTTLDFGPNSDFDGAFKTLRKLLPTGPLMNSEFYTGWLTHWGEKTAKTDPWAVVDGVKWFMSSNVSFNLYMFYGGTNFEFSSGANTGYLPTITSYDYDAPYTEGMDTTLKYFLIRRLMTEYFPELKNITPPANSTKGNYGVIKLTGVANLLLEGREIFGKDYGETNGTNLPTFEKLRQRAGLLLYETRLDEDAGLLEISDLRDRVYVYVDFIYKGLLDREKNIHKLELSRTSKSTLSLLVEHQGRINYGYHELDFKGILSMVIYNGKILDGKWMITGYPLSNMTFINSFNDYHSNLQNGPIVYEGTFELPENTFVNDTYLFTPGWSKGYAWINEKCLGRYWSSRGPQYTLFVPRSWLRQGTNQLQLLELEEAAKNLTVQLISYPVFTKSSSLYYSYKIDRDH